MKKGKMKLGRSDRGSGICGSVLLCGTSGSEYPFLGSVDVYDHCVLIVAAVYLGKKKPTRFELKRLKGFKVIVAAGVWLWEHI